MNTVEDLMKPRFRLIADYPGNTKEIGSISTEVSTATYFRKYPANFGELGWWEERKVEDMPEYVKMPNDYRAKGIHKVVKYDLESGVFFIKFDGHDDYISYFGSDILPATETEYTAYINQLK